MVEILSRGCLQEVMTRFVHRGRCEEILLESFRIPEELHAFYFNKCSEEKCVLTPK